MATDQYTNLEPFGLNANRPKWVADDTESRRVASYNIYDDFYWGQRGAFKVIQHSEEHPPIYVPGSQTIVETMNRYVGNDPEVVVLPEFGSDSEQALMTQMLADLERRERLLSKFATAKRFGIARGDWAFHIYADETREEGSRVSVYAIHPGTLFPIYNPNNIDIIIGWHIAELYEDPETGDDVISRKTYRKVTEAEGPSPITYEHAIFEVDNWGGPGNDPAEIKQLRVVTPLTTLPDPIDHLPVYHIPNFEEPGNIWGSSELRGVETLLNSQQQAVTDEDLALALEGLGVYWSDGGTPIDPDTKEPTGWDIGPGRVAEVPMGRKFGRVSSGADSIEAYQRHISYLAEWAGKGKGINDIATGGSFDVQVAESGVALGLRMGPILSTAEERDLLITTRMDQMIHDLKKWYAAFEDSGFGSLVENVQATMVFGDKLPENRKQKVTQLLAAKAAGVIPGMVVRDAMRKMGYDLPPEDELVAALEAEQTLAAQLTSDVTGARLDSELDASA